MNRFIVGFPPQFPEELAPTLGVCPSAGRGHPRLLPPGGRRRAGALAKAAPAGMKEVLVASDAQAKGLLLASALRLHHHRVTAEIGDPATLAAVAAEKTGQRDPPVLVVDADLDRSEWASAVRKYARSRPGAEIVLVTPSRSKRTEKTASEVGVTRILHRPFSFHQLLDAVEENASRGKPEGAPSAPPA